MKNSTHLFSHRLDAENFNKRELNKIKDVQNICFESIDVGVENYKKALKDSSSLDKLELKIGTSVMLLKNLASDLGLVNGAIGTVIAFEESKSKEQKQSSPKNNSVYSSHCNIRVAETQFKNKNKLFPLVEFHTFNGRVIKQLIDYD